MDKIDQWFDDFFEFTTDDKTTVSSKSCKLFAEYVYNKQEIRISVLTKVFKQLTDDGDKK